MSSRFRVGYNINAQRLNGTDGYLLGHLNRLQATSHLVMHGVGLAQQIYNQQNGDVIVVSRDDYPDGDMWNRNHETYKDPGQLVQSWKRRGFPGLVWYAPNEPWVDENRVDDLMRWLIEVMRASRIERQPAVVWNAATASTVHENWAQSGRYDAFLREADVYTNGGYGWIGYHDYTSVWTPWGAADRNMWDMVHNPSALLENMPTLAEIRANVWRNWLLPRWIGFEQRCRQLGIRMHRVLITEGPLDLMPNLQQAGIISALAQKYGVHFDGPMSQRLLWPLMFPGLSMERAFIKQVRWINQTYPDYVDGYHMFTWSWATPWRPRGFNYGEWVEMHPELETLAAEGQETNMPITISRVHVRSAGTYNVRLRSAPTTQENNIVGRIVAGTTYNGWEFVHLAQNGWRYFEFEDGTKGYVSAQYVSVENLDGGPVVNIPSKVELEALGNELVGINERLDQLIADVATWYSMLL